MAADAVSARFRRNCGRNAPYLRHELRDIVRDRAKIEAFCGSDPYPERDEETLYVLAS
jgi:hypothetical protein